jgi:hypothetical protein
MNISGFFSELKRRNVYKVAVGYAVVGWLVVQGRRDHLLWHRQTGQLPEIASEDIPTKRVELRVDRSSCRRNFILYSWPTKGAKCA